VEAPAYINRVKFNYHDLVEKHYGNVAGVGVLRDQ